MRKFNALYNKLIVEAVGKHVYELNDHFLGRIRKELIEHPDLIGTGALDDVMDGFDEIAKKSINDKYMEEPFWYMTDVENDYKDVNGLHKKREMLEVEYEKALNKASDRDNDLFFKKQKFPQVKGWKQEIDNTLGWLQYHKYYDGRGFTASVDFTDIVDIVNGDVKEAEYGYSIRGDFDRNVSTTTGNYKSIKDIPKVLKMVEGKYKKYE
jgi:hypothetical protein